MSANDPKRTLRSLQNIKRLMPPHWKWLAFVKRKNPCLLQLPDALAITLGVGIHKGLLIPFREFSGDEAEQVISAQAAANN